MRAIGGTLVALLLLSLAGLTLTKSAPVEQTPANPPAASNAPAAAATKPDIEAVDGAASTLVAMNNTAVPGTSAARGTLFLGNKADVVRTVTLTCVLRTALGTSVPCAVDPSVSQLPASTGAAALPFSLRVDTPALDAFPLSGYVGISFTDGSRAPSAAAVSIKPLAVSIKPGVSAGPDWMMWSTSALVALGVVLVSILAIAAFDKTHFRTLFHRMGTPKWSFTASWSSTIGLAGAFITQFTGFAGLPEYGHTMSKNAYLIQSIIAAALVTVAPGVYNLFRKPVKDSGSSPETVQYQGLVLMFLVAALFTLTGALVQLELLRLMMGDIGVTGLIGEPSANALQIVWRALQYATAIYGVFSLVQAVVTPKQKGKPEKIFRDVPGVSRTDPLPNWNLL